MATGGLIEVTRNPGAQKFPSQTPGLEIMQPTATGFDPTRREIDVAKETVSGQLDRLLKADSPYLQQARAGSLQTANERGLINTSMAAGAGEAAAIAAAAPIAAADAGVYDTAAREDVAARNAALGYGAEAANKSALVSATAFNESGLQKQKGEQATQLAQIEANYKQLMQSSSSAASMFSDAQAAVTRILGDPSTSAEQKTSAMTSIKANLQSGLKVIGAIANLNLAGLLTF